MAVLLGADTFADDLGGIDKVPEDGIVHSGQGTVARALLLDAAAAAREGEDAAVSDEDDVTVREFLLEFTSQANWIRQRWEVGNEGLDLSTYRCWTLWKPLRRGKGTKMTTALRP